MERKFIIGRYYWCKNYKDDNWQPCLYLKDCTKSKVIYPVFRWCNPNYGDFFYFESKVFYKIGDIIRPQKQIKYMRF